MIGGRIRLFEQLHRFSSIRIADALLAVIAEAHLHDWAYNNCLRPDKSSATRGVREDDLWHVATLKSNHQMQREPKYPKSATVQDKA